MDFFAIASNGAYPTPTPTAVQRAAYAVTYGLLSLLPTVEVVDVVAKRFRSVLKLGVKVWM